MIWLTRQDAVFLSVFLVVYIFFLSSVFESVSAYVLFDDDDCDDYIWQARLGGIGLVIDGRVDPAKMLFSQKVIPSITIIMIMRRNNDDHDHDNDDSVLWLTCQDAVFRKGYLLHHDHEEEYENDNKTYFCKGPF